MVVLTQNNLCNIIPLINKTNKTIKKFLLKYTLIMYANKNVINKSIIAISNNLIE
jgi:hypothetical protein